MKAISSLSLILVAASCIAAEPSWNPADAAKDAEKDIKAQHIQFYWSGSVAVYPLGDAVFVEAIVDVGDDPRDQVPETGFRRIYTSRYYAIYANC